MTQVSRGVLRLSGVLGLLIGGWTSLHSYPDPSVPFALWVTLRWLMDGVLAFAACWLVLSLVAWAFQGFASRDPIPPPQQQVAAPVPPKPTTSPEPPPRVYTAKEVASTRTRGRIALVVAGLAVVVAAGLLVWVNRLMTIGTGGIAAAEFALAAKLQVGAAVCGVLVLIVGFYGVVTALKVAQMSRTPTPSGARQR